MLEQILVGEVIQLRRDLLYVTALKIFHKREFAARKPVKRRLPEILSRLKNKSGTMTKATFLGVSWKKVNGSWCGKASWSL